METVPTYDPATPTERITGKNKSLYVAEGNHHMWQMLGHPVTVAVSDNVMTSRV